jgi:heterodisulfide reductase subunit A-like polyferredoxin
MSFQGDPLPVLQRNTILNNSVEDLGNQPRISSDTKVGILGAGIAGLYTALILDSLDIEYEIVEASDRTGGRMFTYKFPGGDKYDYYVCFLCSRTTVSC